MCRTSIYDARNNLSNFVKIAESGEPVELTRYDKPVAVIISYEEYKHKDELGNAFSNIIMYVKVRRTVGLSVGQKLTGEKLACVA